MTVLSKYLVKEFFKSLLLCQLIFMSLYLIIHFFGKFDNFAEASVPIGRMLPYLLYKTPSIFVQMLPIAALLGVIIMFSQMKKNNEVLALKASGMSIWDFSKPIFVVSLFLTVSLFFLSEGLVPYASFKSNELYQTEVRKKDPGHFLELDHVWYKGSDCIYYMRHFDNNRMIMAEPVFYFFDHTFRLVKRIDCQQAIWKNGKWAAIEGIITEPGDDNDYRVRKFSQIDLNISEVPEDFIKEMKRPEEMNYWQLSRFAKKLESEGYDASNYQVDMNIKLAFPLITFIMMLVGIPIALKTNKGGAPLAISLGIGACFCYFLSMGVLRSFGLSNILPPILSAWLANGIFFLLGTYLMMNGNR